MAVQDTHNVKTVAEAKANLFAISEQAEAERRAKGPLGTVKGKAVVGGAVAALAIGYLVARPVFEKRETAGQERRPRSRPQHWTPRLDSLRETLRGWREDPQKARNAKKAAVGGLSMGLVMRLARPLLPHLAQFAASKYAQYRMTKAETAQAMAREQVAKAQAAQATVDRKPEGEANGIA